VVDWDSFCVFICGYILALLDSRMDGLTLHITFTFVDDESITSTLSFAVFDYTYTFNGTIHFEFSSEVDFCCLL
jgi:hypothetical protein